MGDGIDDRGTGGHHDEQEGAEHLGEEAPPLVAHGVGVAHPRGLGLARSPAEDGPSLEAHLSWAIDHAKTLRPLLPVAGLDVRAEQAAMERAGTRVIAGCSPRLGPGVKVCSQQMDGIHGTDRAGTSEAERVSGRCRSGVTTCRKHAAVMMRPGSYPSDVRPKLVGTLRGGSASRARRLREPGRPALARAPGGPGTGRVVAHLAHLLRAQDVTLRHDPTRPVAVQVNPRRRTRWHAASTGLADVTGGLRRDWCGRSPPPTWRRRAAGVVPRGGRLRGPRPP